MPARDGGKSESGHGWRSALSQKLADRGGGTPPHPPTVSQNKDGSLNYGGTSGQSERFNRQNRHNLAHDNASNCYGAETANSNVLFALSAQPPEVYDKKNKYEVEVGRVVSWTEFHAARPGDFQVSGTSIFDPVLCEIAYRWFSPVGGLILDPFAGGSVRGIVASKLARQYIGHELRQEQVAENRIQAAKLCGDDERMPVWIEGDSLNIDITCADVHADLVFSCPPYADLEVYSDDPKDLSTMKYSEFKAAYFEIIKKTCDRLKPDSFACFVVGEVRDKKGNYIDFVGDTVQAFRDAGLQYYNEAILITCTGSLAIRAGKQFSASRKFGKAHQNILVFVKGCGKKAAKRCGVVDIDESVFDSIETIGGNQG